MYFTSQPLETAVLRVVFSISGFYFPTTLNRHARVNPRPIYIVL